MEYIHLASVVLLTVFSGIYVYLLRRQIIESSKPLLIYRWASNNTIQIVNAGNGPANNILILSAHAGRKDVFLPLYNGEWGAICMMASEHALLDHFLNTNDKVEIKYKGRNNTKYKLTITYNSDKDYSNKGVRENFPGAKFQVDLSP